MAIGDVIVGLDIGSSKISLLIGKINNFNQIEIMSNVIKDCNGIKKGKIINEDEIAIAISNAIEQAETETNIRINSAYLTIPGKYVTIVQNRIVKEVRDKYSGVAVKDVISAIKQAKDIEVPEGQTIIDLLAEQYMLEDGKIISDPVGSLTSKFILNAQVILADKEYIRKLASIMKKIGIEIDGIIPIALAERNFILDTNELNDNIMLLDIGGGNTEIGVFNGAAFIYTNTIPLGGNNITNDISLVLNINEEEADRLKKQYGLALKSYIDNDNEILLNSVKCEDKSKVIKSSELIEIIEARIEEIFSLVNKDVTNNGIKQNINNVILTGRGITNINKSDIAGKIILNIPVKIATGRLVSTVKPEFRTVYSLVRYIAAKPYTKTVSSSIDTNEKESFLKRTMENIKEFFYS